jgi:hypothetical protein
MTRSLDNLDKVLSEQGIYEDAEDMHRRTLESRERVLDKKHHSTLASMNNLPAVLIR